MATSWVVCTCHREMTKCGITLCVRSLPVTACFWKDTLCKHLLQLLVHTQIHRWCQRLLCMALLLFFYDNDCLLMWFLCAWHDIWPLLPPNSSWNVQNIHLTYYFLIMLHLTSPLDAPSILFYHCIISTILLLSSILLSDKPISPPSPLPSFILIFSHTLIHTVLSLLLPCFSLWPFP